MNNQKILTDVVYKFVPYKRFYTQMEKYLDGNLYFADWHSFSDKREGKYLCSSSVPQKQRDELKNAKYSYKVCSTTLANNVFELWDRYMEDPPAICLAVKIDGLNTANKEKQCFDGFTGHHIDYRHELKHCCALASSTEEDKASEILTTKKNRFIYENEYRLIKQDDSKDGSMHKVGKVTAVIVGGCCPKEDSGFNKLKTAIGNKPLYFKRAYIDFSLESVEINDNICDPINSINGI